MISKEMLDALKKGYGKKKWRSKAWFQSIFGCETGLF